MAVKKIVVCEDDPIATIFLRKALSLIPETQVEFHRDLGPALLAAERLRPDVLIMDHHIAGSKTSGMDGVRRLRSTTWGGTIPVLVHSAADLENQAIQAGANIFLRKPATVDELLRQVNRLLLIKIGPTSPKAE